MKREESRRRPGGAEHVLSVDRALPLRLRDCLQRMHKVSLTITDPCLHRVHCRIKKQRCSTVNFPGHTKKCRLQNSGAFGKAVTPGSVSIVTKETDGTPLYVFRNFISFLSLLAVGKRRAVSPSVILGSIDGVRETITCLRRGNVSSIQTFLSGSRTKQGTLRSLHSTNVGMRSVDQRCTQCGSLGRCRITREAKRGRIVPSHGQKLKQWNGERRVALFRRRMSGSSKGGVCTGGQLYFSDCNDSSRPRIYETGLRAGPPYVREVRTPRKQASSRAG